MILAIDVSQNGTGIAIMEDTKVIHTQYIDLHKKLSIPEKQKIIQNQIRHLIATYNIKICALEDTFMQNNVKTLKQLEQVHGIIQGVLLDNNINWVKYPTATIKKAVLGKAVKGAKKIMQDKLIVDYNLPADTSDNITDAIGIGLTYLQKK